MNSAVCIAQPQQQLIPYRRPRIMQRDDLLPIKQHVTGAQRQAQVGGGIHLFMTAHDDRVFGDVNLDTGAAALLGQPQNQFG